MIRQTNPESEMHRTALKFALSGLIAGSMISGMLVGSETGIAAAHSENGAVSAAEAAVEAAPADAHRRARLGEAYMRAGQLQSAERSLSQALALDRDIPQAVLHLALVETALGRAAAARELLNRDGARIPPADKGLALALAGDTAQAIMLLEQAARGEGTTGRTRQNLALAYAMEGRWREARALAERDVPADSIDRRMAEWARLTDPANSRDLVPALLGISRLVADAGRIERPAPDAAPMAAPVQRISFAHRREIVQPLPEQARTTQPRYVVQIGAYESPAVAAAAWAKSARKIRMLATYAPKGAHHRVEGNRYFRLAIGDFTSRRNAEQLCGQMRNAGQACFVRPGSDERPLEGLAGSGARLAAR